MRIGPPKRNGTFTLTGLPPGSYFVAGLDRMPDGEIWQDASFLGTLAAGATRVTLVDGRPIQIALPAVPR